MTLANIREWGCILVTGGSMNWAKVAHPRQACLHLRRSMNVVGCCSRFDGIDSFEASRPGFLSTYQGSRAINISENSEHSGEPGDGDDMFH
jgi:hypothetical protein